MMERRSARPVWYINHWMDKKRSAERKNWKKEFSAGGIVFRRLRKDVEILLIQPSYEDLKAKDVWTFPKGWTSDHGNETTEETALREVREEGGVEAKIIGDLGDIHYFFAWEGSNVSKTVHYYLMEYVSGNTADHDFEVAEAGWVPLREVKDKLFYKTDQEVFARAFKILKK